MECMPKFVKEGGNLVEGKQRRLALGWLGDVHVVPDHRFSLEQEGLLDVRIHPGAAALGGAREQVGEKERERFSIMIEHLKDADIFLVDGQIFALAKGDPE